MTRVSKATAPLARTDALWLRFCPPRFWREARHQGLDRFGVEGWAEAAPIGFASDRRNNAASSLTAPSPPSAATSPSAASAPLTPLRIDWRLVYRLTRQWERLRARVGTAISFSLRDGLSLEALRAAPPALLRRLPPAVVASLLVHDGQVGLSDSRVGLLFAGARLLSLDELAAAAAEGGDADDGALPLSTRVGFQELAVQTDGRVLMRAGFNTHVKAGDWAAFLELLLVDTV